VARFIRRFLAALGLSRRERCSSASVKANNTKEEERRQGTEMVEIRGDEEHFELVKKVKQLAEEVAALEAKLK
jgi:hypothetical protein